MASTCKNCGGTITWGDHYVKGDKPKNTDGSTHYCKGAPQKTGEPPKSEVPIEQIVAEIQAIIGSFKDSEMEMNAAAMTEGIWKYAISRKMSR